MGEDTLTASFTEFVVEHERRVRNALTASLGIEIGREPTSEALAYAWEHWKRVSTMENPGEYLFVVGKARDEAWHGSGPCTSRQFIGMISRG